VIELV